MAGLGYPSWLQEDAYWHGAVAYGNAAGSHSFGMAFQGPQQGFDEALPGDEAQSKRRHLAEQPQVPLGYAPAPNFAPGGLLGQDDSARQAETMLVQLKQVANNAAATWRETLPSLAQLDWLENQVECTMQHVKRAFPAVAAGVPVAQVPAWEARAADLLAQAKAAVNDALEAANPLQGRAIQQARAQGQGNMRVGAAQYNAAFMLEPQRPAPEQRPPNDRPHKRAQRSHYISNQHHKAPSNTHGGAMMGAARQAGKLAVDNGRTAQDAQRAEKDAKEQRDAATAACTALLSEAGTYKSMWEQRNMDKAPDTAPLQQRANEVESLVCAAWPERQSRPAIVQAANTAVKDAMVAGREAWAAWDAAARDRLRAVRAAQAAKVRDDAATAKQATQLPAGGVAKVGKGTARDLVGCQMMATAACKVLKADALACIAAWKALKDEGPDTLPTLEAHAERVRAQVAAAWPDSSEQPAIVQAAFAAVQQAYDEARAAEKRVLLVAKRRAEAAEKAARELAATLVKVKAEEL